jgi:hypothetical protein
MKFKVGDKVRIVNTNVDADFPGFRGAVGVIKDIDPTYRYPYWVQFYDPDWKDQAVWSNVEANEEKIVITTDGKVTTATLYKDNEKTVANAYCSPEDTFDFNVGAKLAMERLMKAVEPPKYYNGKIVCVNTYMFTNLYTTGKVYEVVNGEFIDDAGNKHDNLISFEYWKKISCAEWLEIKE